MRWDPAPFIAIADAVVLLLQPQAEAVVHDLDTDRILHIAGALSPRRVGDASLNDIKDLKPYRDAVIGPYGKTNVDGRALKSVSVSIPGRDGEPAGLICINLDISALAEAQAVLNRLVALPAVPVLRAEQMFPADWREEINSAIAGFLATRSATLAGLTTADQIDLAAALDARGFFAIRNAADYIARALSVSRATLYKRLAAARSASP